MKIQYEDLNKRYEEFTSRIICKCEAATIIAGGQPAKEDGIRAFAHHHLKLDGDEAENAVKRIMAEEIGEKPVPEAEGELAEKLTYGVNVIRRTHIGPFLGNWMVHACMKQAASRLNIFVDFRGSKGNFAEAGRVLPYGISRRSESPSEIYLIAPDGNPATTVWEEFKGRVSSPQGNKSIVHHTECVPPGTRFEFEFRFIRGSGDKKLSDIDIQDFLALSMIVGLGSVKSLGCGKWRILEAEIIDAARVRVKPKKEKIVEGAVAAD